MKSISIKILFFVLILSCENSSKSTTTEPLQDLQMKDVQVDSIQNRYLLTRITELKQSNSSRDSLLLANYNTALTNFNNDLNPTNTIWLGRRIAYTGEYDEAIQVYTKGIQLFPNEPRLYRHRGHRYITTRQFDSAIEDFEKAANLIKGDEDIIEPDGIPNRLNQPVSSLHTNIWYHLGLAYYVKNDLGKALNAFQYCLNASKNDDMKVATSHWLYMIQRRLGNEAKALTLLESISKDMTIIENDGYHQLLLFYKGELSEDQLKGNGASGSSEAVKYGIANWYHYNGDMDKAKQMYEDLVTNGNRAGFGYIAAEADLGRL